MKKSLPLILGLALLCNFMYAQTATYEKVYQILQTNCATAYCHGGGAAGSLDLKGSGSTLAAQMNDVYSKLVNVAPSNSNAQSIGDKLVYPGRTDKSFLFRKINNGLESTISLDASEGNAMPQAGGSLTDVEKELIRQWISYGAPATGEVVKESLISDYYNVNGVSSFPNGAPAAPNPSEGFQVKMSPFFLAPQNNASGLPDEIEYYQKYALDLPADVEVTRIETFMGTSSHHFILYRYDSPSDANNIPNGLRINSLHNNITLVQAVQESSNINLPQGSAFPWTNDVVLDLNSHYINYSATNTLKSEVYMNVYTQPKGTANQEMQTLLIPKTNIFIPNDGNPYTFSQSIFYNLGDVYMWGIMGHTHQYGTGYEVFLRNPDNTKGQKIYDGACPNGTPGCAAPYFDYQHIPIKYNEPFLPIYFHPSAGIIHEASYVNNGPNSVGWGATSDDEMMVLVLMYLTDTTGVTTSTVKLPGADNPLQATFVYPNPTSQTIYFDLPETVNEVRFSMYDMMGRKIKELNQLTKQINMVDVSDVPTGIYIYQIEDKKGNTNTGKIVVE